MQVGITARSQLLALSRRQPTADIAPPLRTVIPDEWRLRPEQLVLPPLSAAPAVMTRYGPDQQRVFVHWYSPHQADTFNRAAAMHLAVSHRCLVPLRAIGQVHGRGDCIVTARGPCNLTSFLARVHSTRPFDAVCYKRDITRIALHVAEGLEALHSVGEHHGRLSPDFVLITRISKTQSSSGKLLPQPRIPPPSEGGSSAWVMGFGPSAQPDSRTGLDYAAPEVLTAAADYDAQAADVYSFGMLLYTLLHASRLMATGTSRAPAKTWITQSVAHIGEEERVLYGPWGNISEADLRGHLMSGRLPDVDDECISAGDIVTQGLVGLFRVCTRHLVTTRYTMSQVAGQLRDIQSMAEWDIRPLTPGLNDGGYQPPTHTPWARAMLGRSASDGTLLTWPRRPSEYGSLSGWQCYRGLPETLYALLRNASPRTQATGWWGRLDVENTFTLWQEHAHIAFLHKLEQHEQLYRDLLSPDTRPKVSYLDSAFEHVMRQVKQDDTAIDHRHAVLHHFIGESPIDLLHPASPGPDGRPRFAHPRVGEYPSMDLSGLGVTDTSTLRVQVVYHGVPDEATADRILNSGFAKLAALDKGFIGHGLYVSPDLPYALDHFATVDPRTGRKTVLACMVVYGNPFPVTEPVIESVEQEGPHEKFFVQSVMMGAACLAGHDAHISVMHRGRKYPVPEQVGEGGVAGLWKGHIYPEIMVDASAQLLPITKLSFTPRDRR